MGNIPKKIQKIFTDYLDKGMTFEEYCEFVGRDETELKLSILDQVPKSTYLKIRRVYFENEEGMVGNPPYEIRKFTTGRYGLFKEGEFKFMLEIPEGYVIRDTVYTSKYKKILKCGGMRMIINKVKDGGSISEISKFYELNYNVLQQFIRLETGGESMHEFKKRFSGDYLGHLKCKSLSSLEL